MVLTVFSDRLRVSLTLTVGTDEFAIVGGNVERVSLRLEVYGFSGSVVFWVHGDKTEDELLARFVTDDRILVELAVQGELPYGEAPAPPVAVGGWVVDKRVREVATAELTEHPVLARRYEVAFVEPTLAHWSQHYPLVLEADAKLADVLANHVFEGMKLAAEVADANVVRALICLPLDASWGASLADFVADYLERTGGHWLYDYDSRTTRLVDRKSAPGKASLVRPVEVEALRVELPEVARHAPRVHNGHALHATTVPIDAAMAVSGIWQDARVLAATTDAVDSRVELETSRYRPRLPQVHVDFAQYPRVRLVPGGAAGLSKELHFASHWAAAKTWRVVRWVLDVRASSPMEETDRDTLARAYEGSLQMEWENPEELAATFFPHRSPRFPVRVEGQIVSAGNDPGDRWYTVHQDDAAGDWHYKVLVPLWNQEIRTPHLPHFMPGHMYAPLYKDARVLMNLYFDHADVTRVLDWGTDAQLPLSGQGNAILFGKNRASQTSLVHDYADNKPELLVNRSSLGDLQRIEMLEGAMTLQVWEDASQVPAAPTFDLTPEVALSQGKLESSSRNALGSIEGAFAGASTELKGKLEGALTSTGGALDGLQSDVGSVVQQGSARLDAALAGLGSSGAQVASAAAGALAELRASAVL